MMLFFEFSLNLGAANWVGPDGVYPLLLKSCAASLSYPLSIVFCHSLETGNFPSECSVSTVIPLFKSGSCCSQFGVDVLHGFRKVGCLSSGPLFEQQ